MEVELQIEACEWALSDALLPVSTLLGLALLPVGEPAPPLLLGFVSETEFEGCMAPDAVQGAETVTGILTVSVLPERVIVELNALLEPHSVPTGAV